MEIISIVAIGIVGAVISVLLKQYKPEYSMFVQLATGLIIMLLIVSKLSEAVNGISELFSQSSGTEYLEVMLKALGICLLTQFAADTCRDADEQALASKIEFAGKIVVLCIALPLFRYLVEMITGVIGQ